MINSHLRDRFFQRYGLELTPEVMRELVPLALKAPTEPDPAKTPGCERVTVRWRGAAILIVWHRATRTFVTFLPPADRSARLAWPAPKRKRGRR